MHLLLDTIAFPQWMYVMYCQAAHTIIGKMNSFTRKQVPGIRFGHSKKSKLGALAKLAGSITWNKGRADGATVDGLYAQGFTRENLIDVILQVADKIAMNYVHNLTALPVDFPLLPSLELVAINK